MVQGVAPRAGVPRGVGVEGKGEDEVAVREVRESESVRVGSEGTMKVGVLCEFSGTVRDAFIRRGHEAVSCDLLPTEAPGPHIVGDCLAQDWSWADFLVCFPPCTRLCNSGVRWLKERELWEEMRRGAEFFRGCLALGRACACEDPVVDRCGVGIIGRRQDESIQPWMFGHGETKATGLWLRGLPLLRPTNVVGGRVGRVWRESPGPDRWKRRSLTYAGIADAMAEQWGRKGDRL